MKKFVRFKMNAVETLDTTGCSPTTVLSDTHGFTVPDVVKVK